MKNLLATLTKWSGLLTSFSVMVFVSADSGVTILIGATCVFITCYTLGVLLYEE